MLWTHPVFAGHKEVSFLENIEHAGAEWNHLTTSTAHTTTGTTVCQKQTVILHHFGLVWLSIPMIDLFYGRQVPEYFFWSYQVAVYFIEVGQ